MGAEKSFLPGRREEMREVACHCSDVRRGTGRLLSCLILAWACLLCGSSLSRAGAGKPQHQSHMQVSAWLRGKGPGRCLLCSMDQSGSCRPLPDAVVALISPSTLAEEQSPFQNTAQLLQLGFAWRCTPRGPHQVACQICRGCSAAASSCASLQPSHTTLP